MRYDFIVLDDEFKNNVGNIYKENSSTCINLTDIINFNKGLKCPIGIFINGVLLKSSLYEFKNKIVKVDERYPVYANDRIYMIMTSSNDENSGYIFQNILNNFNIIDDNSIELLDPLVNDINNRVLGIVINGVLYSTELFTIRNDIVEFIRYRPNNNDDVSVLILKK